MVRAPTRPSSRRAAAIGLACAWGLALGAAARGRATPPLATVRIDGRDYVRAADAARLLGLSMAWEGPRRLALEGAGRRLEIPAPHAADPKEVAVDGLLVWLGDPVAERAGALYLSRVDFEDRLLPLLRPDLAGRPPRPPRTIALDPGHGGDDTGARNPRLHLLEKTCTLDVALRLRALLEEAGYRVVMTRTTDLPAGTKLDLARRAEIADAARADLFVSIHFNAGATASDTTSRGTEVYTFPPPGQRSTASWGEGVDDSEPNREFPETAPVVRFGAWSAVFAHAMHRQLVRWLGTEDRGERLRHLGVLRGLRCPGILVESAFLTDDAEARRIETPAFRERIAEAMLAGIRAYGAELAGLDAGKGP